MTDQPEAAVFNFDKARIFTRMLAGLRSLDHLTGGGIADQGARPAAGLCEGSLSTGRKVNSPTPRGCTDPSNTLSSVEKTPTRFAGDVRSVGDQVDQRGLWSGFLDRANGCGFGLAIFGLLTLPWP